MLEIIGTQLMPELYGGARMQVGVLLSKDLMAIAGHSLKANITTLGPLVLPISEQLLFFLNLIARKVHASAALSFPSPHCQLCMSLLQPLSQGSRQILEMSV